MIEGFDVNPSQLCLAGGRVRCSARQLAGAGRTVDQALHEAALVTRGSLTSAAAVAVAAAAHHNLGSLGAGVEAVATALDAAASRYASTDALVASLGATQ